MFVLCWVCSLYIVRNSSTITLQPNINLIYRFAYMDTNVPFFRDTQRYFQTNVFQLEVSFVPAAHFFFCQSGPQSYKEQQSPRGEEVWVDVDSQDTGLSPRRLLFVPSPKLLTYYHLFLNLTTMALWLWCQHVILTHYMLSPHNAMLRVQ